MVQQLQNLVGPSPLEQLLGGFTGGFQQSFAQRQQAQAQQALQAQQAQAQQSLQAQKDAASEQRRQGLLASLGIGPVQPPAADVGFQEQQGIAQPEIPEGGILQQALFDPSQVTDEQLVALSLQDPNLAKVVQAQKEQRQQIATENKKEIRESFKDTKEFRSKTTEDFKDTRLINARLDRMKNLNDSGKLAKPITAAVADKLGIPVALFGGPDSEEFDKLSKDLLKGISTYFPGRINQIEVQNFLKTIPTLMQSQEGRDRVIRNVALLSEPREIQFNAMREITREAQANGQPLPPDFEEIVLERIQPRLDEIVQEVSQGLDPREQAVDLQPVTPGTPLNKSAAAKIFEQSNGDPERATQLARELGYDV